VTTTTLDFVSHDLELMMPGSQLMITGATNYGSIGGGLQQPVGMPPLGIPPMGGLPGGMMGGFGQTSPYGSTRPF
jgi:hypothetical protein